MVTHKHSNLDERVQFGKICSQSFALQEANKLCDSQKHAENEEHRNSMTLPISLVPSNIISYTQNFWEINLGEFKLAVKFKARKRKEMKRKEL